MKNRSMLRKWRSRGHHLPAIMATLIVLGFLCCRMSPGEIDKAYVTKGPNWVASNSQVVTKLRLLGYKVENAGDTENPDEDIHTDELRDGLPKFKGVWFEAAHGDGNKPEYTQFYHIYVWDSDNPGKWFSYTAWYVPDGCGYRLAFFNSCLSGLEPSASSFYNKVVSDGGAYIGWDKIIVQGEATDWAVKFFHACEMEDPDGEGPMKVDSARTCADNWVSEESSAWKSSVRLGSPDLRIDLTP